MKRIVTYVEVDGRKKVLSISAPISEDKIITDENLSSDYGIIDANYTTPTSIENKKMTLYYNSDSKTIEVEYTDIEFSDLTANEKINKLKAENDALLAENTSLKEELELTQLALFEVDAKIESLITE